MNAAEARKRSAEQAAILAERAKNQAERDALRYRRAVEELRAMFMDEIRAQILRATDAGESRAEYSVVEKDVEIDALNSAREFLIGDGYQTSVDSYVDLTLPASEQRRYILRVAW